MATIPPDENSYFLDQESNIEMARLIDLDLMLTQHMGGLFPAGIPLSDIHDILDVACGPGGWALEVAFAHPDMRVVGTDISARMLAYARARATVQGLKNASFRFMDATGPMEFPDASFDYVNARGLFGLMWKSAWKTLVSESFRVTRPGGFIRLSEPDSISGVTNSPAVEQLNQLMVKAFCRQGRSFLEYEGASHIGLTPMLRDFLEQAGYREIRQQAHLLDYSFDKEGYVSYTRNLQIGVKLLQPFLLKAGVASQDELDRLYQQMLFDLAQENFHGILYFINVIGRKPL
ncbi:MAG: methyltransferase domain-containing protein [Ktedonobacteraceae bacterium]|nr:methyltransferase domain-containing protein [Ktedonobacteraceae bacterium]